MGHGDLPNGRIVVSLNFELDLCCHEETSFFLDRQEGSISKAVFQLRPVQSIQHYTHMTYNYNIKHTQITVNTHFIYN